MLNLMIFYQIRMMCPLIVNYSGFGSYIFIRHISPLLLSLTHIKPVNWRPSATPTVNRFITSTVYNQASVWRHSKPLTHYIFYWMKRISTSIQYRYPQTISQFSPDTIGRWRAVKLIIQLTVHDYNLVPCPDL